MEPKNSHKERQKEEKIMFDGLKKVGSAFAEKVGNVGKSTAIIGLTAATAVSAMAQDPVSGSMTLPETGVDVPELVKLAVTSMGKVSSGLVAVSADELTGRNTQWKRKIIRFCWI